MSNSPTTPYKTWQIMTIAKKTLGVQYMMELFNVGSRQVDRMSANPMTTESAQSNCIDKYEAILEDMMKIGEERNAQCAVRRQASIVGCTLSPLNGNEPDKPNLPEEMLEDYPALTALHGAMSVDEDEVRVRELYSQFKDEVAQTFTAYLRRKHKD